MVTQFVSINLVLSASTPMSPQIVETQLRKYGEPLRWSITAIQNGQAQVEAIVLHNEDVLTKF